MPTECLQPVAILWDIENCAIPHGVSAEDVALHIRLALQLHLAMNGPIIVFSAYGDFSHLSSHTRQGCHRTGVNLIDIPHGRKDAADKAILVDMFLFALDYPPPCTVVLISGDVDFAPALHKLGQRGYCVVVTIPSGRKVSPALCNACRYLWIWQDVARGKGLDLVKAPSLCMIEEAKGKGWVEGNHDAIKAGLSSYQNGCGNSRKIPVGIFEEFVNVPFHIFKESIFATSNSIFDCDNNPLKLQSLNNGMTTSDIAPLSGKYVCDQFAVPYPQSAHTAKQTQASKQVAHAQSQDTPWQLKVKKKKLKKTKKEMRGSSSYKCKPEAFKKAEESGQISSSLSRGMLQEQGAVMRL